MQALYNCVWALRIAPVYESDGHFPVPDHDLMRFLYSTSTAAFVSDHINAISLNERGFLRFIQEISKLVMGLSVCVLKAIHQSISVRSIIHFSAASKYNNYSIPTGI